ncbi:MAG: YwaF family protein [Clostridia bacterium]|nr:YwaF family protein [Clostridia bacterium]
MLECLTFGTFFWVLIGAGLTVGLYFLLRNKSYKTKKWVIFSILAFALILHFLKLLIPPYSTNEEIRLRDIWFINICGANIFLFPFIFLSKSKSAKDYMFYLGVISGFLALLYPTEAIGRTVENPYILDTIRFYLHHIILFMAPLLMVLLGVHKISYKRVFSAPIGLLLVMLFIMLNQVLQSEIGFINLRSEDFFKIGYKNTSFIWGPGDDDIAQIFVAVSPKIFRVIPFGPYAGQEKFWPWFWIVVPVFVYVTPLAFLVCMIFDGKEFIKDAKNLFLRIKSKFKRG